MRDELARSYLCLTGVDCQTALKSTCWVCGTNPSTLVRQRAQARQIGGSDWLSQS